MKQHTSIPIDMSTGINTPNHDMLIIFNNFNKANINESIMVKLNIAILLISSLISF